MDIKGKVHCLFEQSGTFKQEFRKLGYEAIDYDIENTYNNTDVIVDMFEEIDNGYWDKSSIFDGFSAQDLIIAFFPCIYFCDNSQILHTWAAYPKRSTKYATETILHRSRNRQRYYEVLAKLFCIVQSRNLRMIVENPWGHFSYLQRAFLVKPTLIDKDRTQRGDVYKKPTAYWFVNCEPERRFTCQKTHAARLVKKDNHANKQPGMCNIERSAMTQDYARNFICDFILGKSQPSISPTLFD